MKIFTVIGARPQFIKAAVISRAFAEHHRDVKEILVHTGQHYDANMSDVFFDELKIPRPSHNLGIGGGTHGQNTGRMLEKLEGLMLLEKPDWVLVYGDTDSTLAGALAAAKLHIPVAHVEAGLRSLNRRMPEEINRILTDHVSTMLFAPTHIARNNLIKEGIANNKIWVTGDVMYDAAIYYKEMAKKPKWFDDLGTTPNEFILCTIHRAENTDNKITLENIFQGLNAIEGSILLPMHPRTQLAIRRMELVLPKNVLVIDPVGYLDMIWLESNSRLIITDSGGVQKEAYFHQKPCITLRNETEWTELVEYGFNRLTGSDPERIRRASIEEFPKFTDVKSEIYGKGTAGDLIVRLLMRSV